jgi:hypothetical protein
MYKVSLTKKTIVDGDQLTVTVQNLTKYFESFEDANKYLAYLIEAKNIQSFMPEVEYFELTQNLDVDEIKKEDALSKLSPEEKTLLGL